MSKADDTAGYARRLIHVPIIHSPADMGTLAADLEAAYIERLGRRHWDEHLALIEHYWREIRAEIERLGLDYGQVDLYQDGLPVCGIESVLVEKAATAGSENHQLLLELAARGATLMGTEDPKLLLEEYRNIKAAGPGETGPTSPAQCAGHPIRHKQTLSSRDAYIGQRIGQTLRSGRTGFLFLGLMHNVEPHLAADIVVTHLSLCVSGRGDAAR